LGTIFVYNAYKKIKIKTPLYIKRFRIKIDFGGFETTVVIGNTSHTVPRYGIAAAIIEVFICTVKKFS